MDGQTDAGWMLHSFIHNYAPTLAYNLVAFPKNALIIHEEGVLHYKKTSLQVTVITSIIISLSQHHLQGCRCRILPPAFFKYQNCKIAYRPKVTATLSSGLDMGMNVCT
jgi:hypothetical protein